MICAAPIVRGPDKGKSATGTAAGYKRHWKAGEQPCPPCRVGWGLRAQAFVQANPESRRATKLARRPRDAELMREARVRDPERYRGHRRRSERRHPEARRERARRWRETNREGKRVIDARRRARLRAALTVDFTVDQLAQRMAMWGDRCWICRGPFEQIDHVIALARGGAHCLANLRPICKSCNCSKKDRSWRSVVEP